MFGFFRPRKTSTMPYTGTVPPFIQIAAHTLTEEISSLPDMPTDGKLPAESEWATNMNRLKELASGTADPMQFLQWDVIRHTMFVDSPRFVKTELRALKVRPDWREKWEKAIHENPVGTPTLSRHCKFSSGNLIHHAYHLSQLEQQTGRSIKDLSLIVEFGGGYGSMCRACHNLGFKGTYIIFDLPHFSALQRFYLKALGLPVQTLSESEIKTIHCVSDITEFRSLMNTVSQTHPSLFIATWSLSETPAHIRETFSPLIQNLDSHLIAYQHQFGEVNNIKYFSTWRSDCTAITDWADYDIAHLKGNRYLIGSSKQS